jgi:hypothetical protein
MLAQVRQSWLWRTARRSLARVKSAGARFMAACKAALF